MSEVFYGFFKKRKVWFSDVISPLLGPINGECYRFLAVYSFEAEHKQKTEDGHLNALRTGIRCFEDCQFCSLPKKTTNFKKSISEVESIVFYRKT